ncbi:uncharacterized protein LOC111390020 [Olea europaea var. sylvestris]|uniref:uncharacterized protein LOC111390020 n=1 Tax=Olea europaea var. sylvestris TaxID=158386 RepID=UPI000C1D6B17|nr:uncharacterized protein LOC111390020 [Olea europaea var. sylvestris]
MAAHVVSFPPHEDSDKRFQQYPSMCYRHGGSGLVSHLSFADDMIIFANGQKQSIRRVLDCLEQYEGVSGQLVNRDKCGIILSRWAYTSQIRRLEIVTGFRYQQQPFTYLGVPLFKGTKRSFLYDDLIQKIRNRISGWASRLLSPGGRITLLRSVLSSIPLHLLQIMQPPKAVLKKLESIFARFLWDSKDVYIGGVGRRFAFLLMREASALGDYKMWWTPSP